MSDFEYRFRMIYGWGPQAEQRYREDQERFQRLTKEWEAKRTNTDKRLAEEYHKSQNYMNPLPKK
jgi:hypothetical protein